MRGVVAEHRGAALWLLRDSLGRAGLLVAAIVAAGGVAVAARFMALAAAASSVANLGREVGLRTVRWLPAGLTTGQFLAAAGGTVVALMFFAGALSYWAQVRSVTLGRRYQELCAARVLERLAAGGYDSGGETQASLVNAGVQLAGGGARSAGVALALFVNGLPVAVKLLGALAVLLVISPPLTGVVVVLAGVAFSFHYRVSEAARRQARTLDTLRVEASRELREAVKSVSGMATDADGAAAAPGNLSLENNRRFLDVLQAIQQAPLLVQLVSAVTFAIVVLSVLITVGTRAIEVGRGWGNLVAYFVALRFAFASVEDLARRAQKLHQLYPYLISLYRFFTGRGLEPVTTSAPTDENEPAGDSDELI